MTEHTDKVNDQAEKLNKERQDKQIRAIEIRPGRIQTWYESGKVVSKYQRDKRRKTTIDYRGIE